MHNMQLLSKKSKNLIIEGINLIVKLTTNRLQVLFQFFLFILLFIYFILFLMCGPKTLNEKITYLTGYKKKAIISQH
jgi:hypothetical protein